MTRTILLADDSVTIQKVIELTFLEEDYRVVAVSSGDDALDKLTEVVPDLVIADIHMPGSSGYEVSRRSKQLHPSAPVVLLVGTFEPFDEAEAEASGADANLKKPFDSQELLELVEGLLGSAAPETAAAPASGDWEAPAPTAPASADPFPLAAATSAAGDDDVFQFAAESESEPESEPPAPTGWDLDLDTALDAEAADATDDLGALDEAAPLDEPDEPAEDDLLLVDDSPFSALDADEGEPFRLGDDDELAPPLEAAEAADVADTAGDLGALGPEPEPEPIADEPEEPATPVAAEVPVAMEEPVAAEVPEATEEPEPVAAAAPAGGGGPLSDDDVDRIARRLAEVLGDRVVREVAWEVIPDLAEVVIKDRLRELEGQID